MRVTTNPQLIRRRNRLGTYTSLAGIAVLMSGMFFAFQRNQSAVWVSLVALIAGFALAQVGTYNLRRWGRSPRPDEILAQELKGFDDRYHLYTWTLPVPYVLLTPQGLYNFTTRDQTGEIAVRGANWRSKASLSKILTFFGSEGLGNPTIEAQAQADKLRTWLKSKLPGAAAEVMPVVVFIDPRVKLEVAEPTVPVLDAKNVKKWLRGGGKGQAALSPADFKAIEELLDAQPGSSLASE